MKSRRRGHVRPLSLHSDMATANLARLCVYTKLIHRIAQDFDAHVYTCPIVAMVTNAVRVSELLVEGAGPSSSASLWPRMLDTRCQRFPLLIMRLLPISTTTHVQF